MPLAPLPVIAPVPVGMANFATDERPIRCSKVGRFLSCPMGVVLTTDESEGNRAAQTGNMFHDLAEAYHKHKGDEDARVAAGLAALAKAREDFPEGDEAKAVRHYRAYVADPENQTAKVIYCEQPVRLVLDPDPSDPTGKPVVIAGTLDQVRLHKDGRLRVWDTKTGDAKKLHEYVDEYLIQQACYTLAAIQTLDPAITPGGLIWTPAYFSARSTVHKEMPLTVDTCRVLLDAIPYYVARIRQGHPVFVPAAEHCKWCDVRPWPTCHRLLGRLK